MSKTLFALLFFAFTTICNGQTTQSKYFKDRWLNKEALQKKARFSQTIIQNLDSTVTTEIRDLRKNEIVLSETYKGDEPYGVWKFRKGNDYSTLDYNFPLVYSDKKCNDSLSLKLKNFFQDNDSLGYKAPKLLTGESTLYQFISENIVYPVRAREEFIQGIVYIMFTLTKEGTIENIVVLKGTNILLDKEAARVIRKLQLKTPPTINGQAYTLRCLVLPIAFKLII